MESLAKRVAGKLEEGDYRGAVRLACSDDTLADRNDATYNALQQKHPPPHSGSSIPPAPVAQSDTILLSVSEDEIIRAINSFPPGSAGGPDGLRPQHLKDMVGPAADCGQLGEGEGVEAEVSY